MEKLKIDLSPENGELLDKVVKLIGFRSRENLVEVAVKRCLDRYRILFKSANLRWSGRFEKKVEEAESK